VEAFAHDLSSTLYGNPHSENDPAAAAGHKIDDIRNKTLRFFGADPKEYDLIFVANATAGLKLVGDVFRDHVKALNREMKTETSRARRLFKGKEKKATFQYMYHKDAHNSVVGIRALTPFVKVFENDEQVEEWISDREKGGPDPFCTSDCLPSSTDKRSGQRRSRGLTLFAFPGQSNLTGRRLPLHWTSKLRDIDPTGRTFTMLDAAALGTAKKLEISKWKPDFVVLSMYKIFGFPDLGVLIVNKARTEPLFRTRMYFGGGTVEMVLPFDSKWMSKKDGSIHDAAEDGTLPFHNIMALGHALDSIEKIYGGIANVGIHTRTLATYLHDELIKLRHSNGSPVVRILKDWRTKYGDPDTVGGTVSFLVFTPEGSFITSHEVEKAANEYKVYLRAGSMCNPGGIVTYLSWTSADLKAAFNRGHKCSDPNEMMLGRPVGVVRASLGACSAKEDIDTLIHMLKEVYVEDGQRTKEKGKDQTIGVQSYEVELTPPGTATHTERCGYKRTGCGSACQKLHGMQPGTLPPISSQSHHETAFPKAPDQTGYISTIDKRSDSLPSRPTRHPRNTTSSMDTYIAASSGGLYPLSKGNTTAPILHSTASNLAHSQAKKQEKRQDSRGSWLTGMLDKTSGRARYLGLARTTGDHDLSPPKLPPRQVSRLPSHTKSLLAGAKLDLLNSAAARNVGSLNSLPRSSQHPSIPSTERTTNQSSTTAIQSILLPMDPPQRTSSMTAEAKEMVRMKSRTPLNGQMQMREAKMMHVVAPILR
jgi:selenocysteine lyase/cysteine desulfurase